MGILGFTGLLKVTFGHYSAERTQNTRNLRDTCVTHGRDEERSFRVLVAPPTSADAYGYIVSKFDGLCIINAEF